MPEYPPPKYRPHDVVVTSSASSRAVEWRGAAYADLHAFASRVPSGWCDLEVTSNASFLRGASHPEELVAQAASVGHRVAAITDFATLGGAVRAHTAALEHKIPLALGTKVRFFLEPLEHLESLNPLEPPGFFEPSAPQDSYDCSDANPEHAWQRTRTKKLDRATDPHLRLSHPNPCHSGRGLELLLFPSDRASYGAMCRLITIGRRRAQKGACLLALHDLFEVLRADLAGALRGEDISRSSGGLLAVLLPPAFPDETHFETARVLRALFGRDRFSLGVRRLGDPDDRERSLVLESIAQSLDIPLVALGDVRMHTPDRLPLLDVLACIRGGVSLERAEWRLQRHAERVLKNPTSILQRFADRPQWLERAGAIAARASQFSLAELRYEYPDEIVPAGVTPMQYLRELTWQGAQERSRARGGISERVRRQIEHEFAIIEDLNYAPFFLTVYDLVRFARSRGILCQGRGAAANSAVCFSLGITSVDPDRIDVLFERFVSRERNEPPDIDVDFEHERREEVMQYLYTKYGRHRAALTAEVITYRARSAMRDVGKVFGVAPELLTRLGEAFGPWHTGPIEEARLREVGLDPAVPLWQRITTIASSILGFPRHRSQHVGGFVITRGAIDESVPVENAAMAGRTIIEWDKDDIEALGMLKVDVLALGMLTCIRKAITLINTDLAHKLQAAPEVQAAPEAPPPRESLEFHTIPAEDSRVYDMVCKADTIGVFQIESRAQMSMLPRLRPRSFYDLVIEVAIVRPGPIQGDMVHPYLRRRNGEEPIEYPSAAIEQVLGKTLGVPLFQEQAMALAVVAAGFTPGKADELRRAIASWKRKGNLIVQFGESLVGGMLERGYSEKFALQVFEQLKGFSGYGFPESHAASFALLVYVSAWIKCFHPSAFAAALLNSQPMGFYAPSQIVRDAEAHSVVVRQVDIHASDWDCSLERCVDSAPDCVSTMMPVIPFAPFVPFVPLIIASDRRTLYEDREMDIRRPSAAFVTPDFTHAKRIASGVVDGRFEVATQPALRLGLRLVRGFDASEAEQLLAARATHTRFTSIRMLQDVSGLSSAALQKLAQADAFRSMGLDRQQALWHILALRDRERPLWDIPTQARTAVDTSTSKEETEPEETARAMRASQAIVADDHEPELPRVSELAQVARDYSATGLSLKNHPIACIRREVERLGCVPCAWLADESRLAPDVSVGVAGLVTVRQRPQTAKGILFVTLEDETGIANLIVRKRVYERFRKIARMSVVLLARGKVERRHGVVHVLVGSLRDVGELLTQKGGDIENRSRDFH